MTVTDFPAVQINDDPANGLGIDAIDPNEKLDSNTAQAAGEVGNFVLAHEVGLDIDAQLANLELAAHASPDRPEVPVYDPNEPDQIAINAQRALIRSGAPLDTVPDYSEAAVDSLRAKVKSLADPGSNIDF